MKRLGLVLMGLGWIALSGAEKAHAAALGSSSLAEKNSQYLCVLRHCSGVGGNETSS